jgi:hypothetical protein
VTGPSGTSGTGQPAPEPGTRLVAELRLLLEAVADRAGPWLDQVAASSHSNHAGSGESVDGRRTCCPLCALIAMVRGEPSDLAAHGLDRAADLVGLLRAVLADRWEPGTPHMSGFPPARETGDETPQPAARQDGRVQHIPVRRKDKPVEPS